MAQPPMDGFDSMSSATNTPFISGLITSRNNDSSNRQVHHQLQSGTATTTNQHQYIPNLFATQQQHQLQQQLQLQQQAQAMGISPLALGLGIGKNSMATLPQFQQLMGSQTQQQQPPPNGQIIGMSLNQGFGGVEYGNLNNMMMQHGNFDTSQIATLAGLTGNSIGGTPNLGVQMNATTSSANPATISSIHRANGNESSGREPSFPVKLHRILSNPEFRDIICWLPHGRSWSVLKPTALEDKVVPLYFRHAKYASFMRQVNGWGFKRITSGPDHNSYYHDMFLRGKPDLCAKMRRPAKSTCKKSKRDEDDAQAPDFYLISNAEPLPDDGNLASGPTDERNGKVQSESDSMTPSSISVAKAMEVLSKIQGNDRSPKAQNGKGKSSGSYSANEDEIEALVESAISSESKRKADLVRKLKQVIGDGGGSEESLDGTGMMVAQPASQVAPSQSMQPQQHQQQPLPSELLGNALYQGNQINQILLLQQMQQQQQQEQKNPAHMLLVQQQAQQREEGEAPQLHESSETAKNEENDDSEDSLPTSGEVAAV